MRFALFFLAIVAAVAGERCQVSKLPRSVVPCVYDQWSMDSDLHAVNGTMNTLKAELKATKNENIKVKGYLKTLRAENTKMKTKLTSVQAEYKKIHAELKKNTDVKLKAAVKSLKEDRKVLAKSVKTLVKRMDERVTEKKLEKTTVLITKRITKDVMKLQKKIDALNKKSREAAKKTDLKRHGAMLRRSVAAVKRSYQSVINKSNAKNVRLQRLVTSLKNKISGLAGKTELARAVNKMRRDLTSKTRRFQSSVKGIEKYGTATRRMISGFQSKLRQQQSSSLRSVNALRNQLRREIGNNKRLVYSRTKSARRLSTHYYKALNAQVQRVKNSAHRCESGTFSISGYDIYHRRYRYRRFPRRFPSKPKLVIAIIDINAYFYSGANSLEIRYYNVGRSGFHYRAYHFYKTRARAMKISWMACV